MGLSPPVGTPFVKARGVGLSTAAETPTCLTVRVGFSFGSPWLPRVESAIVCTGGGRLLSFMDSLALAVGGGLLPKS